MEAVNFENSTNLLLESRDVNSSLLKGRSGGGGRWMSQDRGSKLSHQNRLGERRETHIGNVTATQTTRNAEVVKPEKKALETQGWLL